MLLTGLLLPALALRGSIRSVLEGRCGRGSIGRRSAKRKCDSLLASRVRTQFLGSEASVVQHKDLHLRSSRQLKKKKERCLNPTFISFIFPPRYSLSNPLPPPYAIIRLSSARRSSTSRHNRQGSPNSFSEISSLE